jgi:hypothetical protein
MRAEEDHLQRIIMLWTRIILDVHDCFTVFYFNAIVVFIALGSQKRTDHSHKYIYQFKYVIEVFIKRE